jgi:hypothetical protein
MGCIGKAHAGPLSRIRNQFGNTPMPSLTVAVARANLCNIGDRFAAATAPPNFGSVLSGPLARL